MTFVINRKYCYSLNLLNYIKRLLVVVFFLSLSHKKCPSGAFVATFRVLGERIFQEMCGNKRYEKNVSVSFRTESLRGEKFQATPLS